MDAAGRCFNPKQKATTIRLNHFQDKAASQRRFAAVAS